MFSVRLARPLAVLLAAALCVLLWPAVASAASHSYGLGYAGYTDPTQAGVGSTHGQLTCSLAFTPTSATQQLSSVGVRYAANFFAYSGNFQLLIGLYQLASATSTSAHTLLAAGNQGNPTTFSATAATNDAQLDVSNFKYSTTAGFTGLLVAGTYYAACYLTDLDSPIYAQGGHTDNPYYSVSFSNGLPTQVTSLTRGTLGTQYVYATTADLVVPPSSTANGAFYSDPFFSGFWGQTFYVHGRAGAVYSIISDQSALVNAQFVFLSNLTCPVLAADEPAKVHCSSHPGTYCGSMAIRTGSGDWLHVVSGGVQEGFGSVTVNGQLVLAVNDSYGLPNGVDEHGNHMSPDKDTVQTDAHAHDHTGPGSSPLDHPGRQSLYVRRTSARSLVVHVGVYEMLIENSDQYVDLVQVQVTNWTTLLTTLQPSGLMGRTWNNTERVELTQADEEQYREQDTDILGCNTQRDKFCSSSGAQHTAPRAAVAQATATTLRSDRWRQVSMHRDN